MPAVLTIRPPAVSPVDYSPSSCEALKVLSKSPAVNARVTSSCNPLSSIGFLPAPERRRRAWKDARSECIFVRTPDEELPMRKERFDERLESVRQGGAVLRGEMEPARVFRFDDEAVRRLRAGKLPPGGGPPLTS